MKSMQLLPAAEVPDGFPLRLYRALQPVRCSGCGQDILGGERLSRAAQQTELTARGHRAVRLLQQK